jgi:hypothetical protein
MSATTETVPIALLRRIGQLTVAGASNASIAATLTVEGYPLPRDGAFDNRLAPASGFNINNEWPGNPSRWTTAAVATIKAAAEYVTLSAAGFPGAGSHALTIA